MKEVICEHCKNLTTQWKTVYIENVPFTGHADCMDDLVDMHEEGRYTLQDFIKELKN